MAENRKNNSLFREKNMERISSPEVLDQYLKVTSPGVWLSLAAIIVLLIGVCIWGIFGRITSYKDVAVVSDGNETYCYVPQSTLKAVIDDPVVEIDGKEYRLFPDTPKLNSISDDTSVYVRLAGNLKLGDMVYVIPLKEKLDEGIYTGSIVTEKLKPISLILN